jgi:hypothetical protein
LQKDLDEKRKLEKEMQKKPEELEKMVQAKAKLTKASKLMTDGKSLYFRPTINNPLINPDLTNVEVSEFFISK